MLDPLRNPESWQASPLRAMLWLAAVALLMLPLATMPFTDEVNWTVEDFVFAGIVILAAVIPLDVAMCKATNGFYRVAVVVALAGMFLLTWLSASVGIIGRDGDPANLMYLVVIVAGINGAFVARARADGLSRTLLSMSVLQALIAGIAIFGGLGRPWSDPAELVALNAFFVALFGVAAVLFAKARVGHASR